MKGTYLHYKGGKYDVIGVAQHTETAEKLVVYKDTNFKIWSRPLEMFNEEVELENGEFVKRFVKINE